MRNRTIEGWIAVVLILASIYQVYAGETEKANYLLLLALVVRL